MNPMSHPFTSFISMYYSLCTSHSAFLRVGCAPVWLPSLPSHLTNVGGHQRVSVPVDEWAPPSDRVVRLLEDLEHCDWPELINRLTNKSSTNSSPSSPSECSGVGWSVGSAPSLRRSPTYLELMYSCLFFTAACLDY
eukprot:GHVU01226069.1.p1 GENE.GHVU01226069.1~~GHVU01226069.1.p1  ORF type:complete len:137 (-),score=0.20 GHVU01226069.1:21-431(-)